MPRRRPTPRAAAHLEALRAAGLDTEAFFTALAAVRNDSALPAAHRELIYRCVAMECFAWYLEAVGGAPVDRVRAAAEARARAEAETASDP